MEKSINEKKQCVQTDVMQSVLKASDLRIGNLVECFGAREVIAIKKHKIKVQHESKQGNFIIEWCPITSLSLKPILLTKEWLLKFGFSNIQYNKEIDCNIYSGWDFGSICIQYPRGIEAHIFLGNYPVAIKYVHELQNLYFALKGRELTVA